MSLHLPPTLDYLVRLPSSQRLPSIRATVRTLPHPTTRVEVLCALVYAFRSESDVKASKREVAQVDALLIEQCQALLRSRNVNSQKGLDLSATHEYSLAPLIVALSRTLPLVSSSSLSYLDVPILCNHILLSIASAFECAPSSPDSGAAVQSLTHLLSRCIPIVSSSSKLVGLLDNIAHLAEHLASPTYQTGAAPDSTTAQSAVTPRLLIFTSLSLTVITALLCTPLPQPDYGPLFASRLLNSMSSFSSVIFSRFGGPQGTFPQLRRVFYSSLDILATSSSVVDAFIAGFAGDIDYRRSSPNPDVDLRVAFLLTASEALLPAVSPALIRAILLPRCRQCLEDTPYRPKLEAAHSLFIAMMALPSASQPEDTATVNGALPEVAQYVPPYTACLLKHLATESLSANQFALAFSSLVRACAALPPTRISSGAEIAADTLAWYCVQSLTSAILDLSHTPHASKEHYGALIQTLISLIPAVPVSILPALLQYVEAFVLFPSRSTPWQEQERGESVDRVWEAVRSVGEGSRALVLEWWLGVKGRMAQGAAGRDDERMLARL